MAKKNASSSLRVLHRDCEDRYLHLPASRFERLLPGRPQASKNPVGSRFTASLETNLVVEASL